MADYDYEMDWPSDEEGGDWPDAGGEAAEQDEQKVLLVNNFYEAEGLMKTAPA